MGLVGERRTGLALGHEPLYRLVEKLASGETLDSLYREWPVGSVLVGTTNVSIPTKPAAVLQGAPAVGNPAILLERSAG
jgi:hypothetical protein